MERFTAAIEHTLLIRLKLTVGRFKYFKCTNAFVPIIYKHFYPRNTMLARVIAIATCLSVRLSVHPSHAGILSKRRKLASWFLHHLVAPWF